jgi:hypothetical protein
MLVVMEQKLDLIFYKPLQVESLLMELILLAAVEAAVIVMD